MDNHKTYCSGGGQPVAVPIYRMDIAWIVGVWFDFPAQARNLARPVYVAPSRAREDLEVAGFQDCFIRRAAFAPLIERAPSLDRTLRRRNAMESVMPVHAPGRSGGVEEKSRPMRAAIRPRATSGRGCTSATWPGDSSKGKECKRLSRAGRGPQSCKSCTLSASMRWETT